MNIIKRMSRLAVILAQGIDVVINSGDVTPVAQPHGTGWRILPDLMCSQTQRGRAHMRLDGGVEHPVPTGSLMVLPPGIHHRIDLVTPTGRARWVHLRYTVLGGLDLFALVEMPPVLPPAIGTPFGNAIEDWVQVRCDSDQPLLRAASMRAFGFRLMEILAPACSERQEATYRIKTMHQLRPVIDHLHRSCDQPCSRDGLAAMIGMRSATFHRAFLACTGTTPIVYLRRLRMQHAQRLLIANDLQVAEIAHRCGYEDPFVFSRSFRGSCGMSPQRYRQMTCDLGQKRRA
ncbi:MAG: AraC family transcriptional regulator [Planctomycetota bacterium]